MKGMKMAKSGSGQDNNFRVMQRETPKGQEEKAPKRKGATMRKK